MDVPRFVECTAESTRGLESPLWPLPHHLFIPGDSPATETCGGSLVPFGVSGRGFLSLILVLGVEEIQQRALRLLPRPWDCCVLYTVFF